MEGSSKLNLLLFDNQVKQDRIIKISAEWKKVHTRNFHSHCIRVSRKIEPISCTHIHTHMYMCVYIYIYACIYIHTHIYIHLRGNLSWKLAHVIMEAEKSHSVNMLSESWRIRIIGIIQSETEHLRMRCGWMWGNGRGVYWCKNKEKKDVLVQKERENLLFLFLFFYWCRRLNPGPCTC
jgi:hypothetical protein